MLLAPGQTNVLRIYYLWEALYFQGTAVDLKQLINTQHSFFIWTQTMITDATRHGT